MTVVLAYRDESVAFYGEYGSGDGDREAYFDRLPDAMREVMAAESGKIHLIVGYNPMDDYDDLPDPAEDDQQKYELRWGAA